MANYASLYDCWSDLLKKNTVVFVIWSYFFIFGCCFSPEPINERIPEQREYSSQFKLTFTADKPSDTMTKVDVFKLLDEAKLTGIDLGYKIFSINEHTGLINFTFIDEKMNQIKINIRVEAAENYEKIYVFMAAYASSHEIAALAMNRFKEKFKIKLK